jgi:hypothetical protein
MNYIIKNTETGLFVIGKQLSDQVLWHEGSILDAAAFNSMPQAKLAVNQIVTRQPGVKLEIMKIFRDKHKNIKVEGI